MTALLLQLAHFLTMASSVLLAVVTLNQRLFARFAASPKAFGILGLALVGVGFDGSEFLDELDHAGVLALAWHGAMWALDVAFMVTVARRLLAVRQIRATL